MPVSDPAWQAARCGLPGDTTAVNRSAQVAQFLASHGVTPVYAGARVWTVASTSSGVGTQFFWLDPATVPGGFGWLPAYDLDQPVIMPGGVTAIGRIEVAVQAIGNGADLQVTLYPDSSGNPNLASPLASATVPAAHIAALSATGSLASAGPLATAASNTAFPGSGVTAAWSQPAVSLNGTGTFATPVTSGNWTLFLGGFDATAVTAIAQVTSVQYLGGGAVSGAIPQPSLPQAAWFMCAAATPDAIVAAGGTGTGGAFANVWTAPWDPATGTLGAWSAQQSLPAVNVSAGMAAWNETVYVTGGTPSTGASAVAAVWYAAVANGQVTSWTAGPPLPKPLSKPYTAVAGNWLIVAGGVDASGTALSATWYSAINGDGSLAGWQAGPPLPAPAYAFGPAWNLIVTDSAVTISSGTTTGGAASVCTQVLAVSPDGPAPEWQLLDYNLTPAAGDVYQAAAYPSGNPGEWEAFGFIPASYTSAALYPVPVISVPLPASGLTPGATYHLVFRQAGGDALNNYVQAGELGAATPPAPWLYSVRGSGGPWSSHANRAVAVSVYDQSATGPLLHLYEDAGARLTTLVQASASGQLLGVCEATQFADGTMLAPVTQVTYGPTGLPSGTVQLA